MKDTTKITLGILITIFIYSISILISKVVKIPIEFIPSGFMTQLTMLAFSGISIFYFQSKGILNFTIKRFRIKLVLRTIITAIIVFIIVNVVSTIVIKIINVEITKAPNPFMKYSSLQYFIFISVFACVSEEFLFRGFLLNMLEPLKNIGVKLFRIKFSFSAIISGVLFGLGHLILLTSGADLPFVLRILFFTTIVGIMNGYFQEKYENNTLVPIIAHITVNTIGFLIMIVSLK